MLEASQTLIGAAGEGGARLGFIPVRWGGSEARVKRQGREGAGGTRRQGRGVVGLGLGL